MFQLIRFLLVISGTVVGVVLGYGTISQYENIFEVENAEIKWAALLGCIGYLISSMAGRELEAWLQSKIENTNSYDLAWGGLGLILGLFSANLLFIPVYFLMYKGWIDLQLDNKYYNSLIPFFHLVLPLFFNLFFGYLGMSITFRLRSAQSRLVTNSYSVPPKLIDSSAVIDGRFADLFRLGFIEGQMIVPKFVINELQFLADGPDASKRGKGRQALDLLNALRKQFPDHVLVSDKDFPQFYEVDAKLVEHAKSDGACLVTQDFNLKKVAELQDIRVLNLNDLINALKPILISGEDVEVQIIKAGKEPNQGVGYLSDGTMIVVEDGGDSIGKKVITTVTNILQTTAGRMIFTRIGKRK